ncbi:hypothetical protein TCAL_06754 [Tigriopus californicus]|uniref:Uncharacterized protein n=1 Tax=Tigriopus californicus TaxID=6832 RepID=A0A553PME6_TIGCA|nr:androgen-induced gene 1 protein-like [Tigriopus californicus]TRY78836.1 hypothetical protein TCAL_06754 [Tigriopus californicus]|eukprot:TCALIF_06754-PA protein Name:"Similar to Aig1 Androgen-induced gene 1 protein (Mus musculus)" AED:0.16 eAED:0.17 QI:0/0/0/1/1/1/3/0/251
MGLISILVHLIGVASFALVIWQQLQDIPIPLEVLSKLKELGTLEFGGNWKYLTFWNLWLQLFYFGLCLINDVLGRKGFRNTRTKLARLEDHIFASLGFPMGMIVGIVFWTFYFVDRELSFPEILDQVVPSWANHLMHTIVVPLQLYEMIFVYHKYPSNVSGSMTTVGYNFIYICWTLYVAYVGGFWVYPILQVLPPIQRALFIAAMSLFGAVVYFAGKGINRLVWGQDYIIDHQPLPKNTKASKSKSKKYA